MKNLFLIRHGKSMQNSHENFEIKLPDPKVYLKEEGKEQARDCGIILNKYIEDNNLDRESSIIYNSPFVRTRETKDIINEYLKIKREIESYLIIEHQYGLFSDTPFDVSKEKYPEFYAYYDNFYKNGCKFYIKFPMGESPADVALRTRIFLQEMYKDCEDIDNVFVISHGNAIKTMIMNIYNYSPEWYSHTRPFNNCEARVIEYPTKEMKILRK